MLLYSTMASANSDSPTFFFPIYLFYLLNMAFYLSCISAVTRTSKSRLNKSGESGHMLCFWSQSKRLQLFIIEYDFSCGLLLYGFTILMYIIAILTLLRIFYHKQTLNFCQMLLCFYQSFILLIWSNILIDL